VANFIEIFSKLINENPDSVRLQNINQFVSKVDRGSKRKAPYIQVNVHEETAANYLSFGKHKEIGFMFHVDFEEWDRINQEIESTRQ
jgi:hypothetical protein